MKYISDQVMVMNDGVIVEMADSDEIYRAPTAGVHAQAAVLHSQGPRTKPPARHAHNPETPRRLQLAPLGRAVVLFHSRPPRQPRMCRWSPCMTPPALTQACEAGSRVVREAIDAMVARKGARRDLRRMEPPLSSQEDACMQSASMPGRIHPTRRCARAAEECEQKFTALNTELYPEREALRAREGRCSRGPQSRPSCRRT